MVNRQSRVQLRISLTVLKATRGDNVGESWVRCAGLGCLIVCINMFLIMLRNVTQNKIKIYIK